MIGSNKKIVNHWGKIKLVSLSYMKYWLAIFDHEKCIYKKNKKIKNKLKKIKKRNNKLFP